MNSDRRPLPFAVLGIATLAFGALCCAAAVAGWLLGAFRLFDRAAIVVPYVL